MIFKGKRSKRPRPTSPLALTMATTSSSTDFSDRLTPSPSNSGELFIMHSTDEEKEEEEDMANCLILLAKGTLDHKSSSPPENYQCKTCNKSFLSFQALGGHRASHKKPNNNNKTMLLALEEKKDHKQSNRVVDDDGSILSLQINSSRIISKTVSSRVHECSICGAEFGSGQALGGHMRRHRPVAPHPQTNEVKRSRNNMLSLDLNLPAPEDNNNNTDNFNPFVTNNKEQVIVFSASPLVDCQY